eukprot:1128155_1
MFGRNDYGQLGYGDTNDRGNEANEMGDNLFIIDLGLMTVPTTGPTIVPTSGPTGIPTGSPNAARTSIPTGAPTTVPSTAPSAWEDCIDETIQLDTGSIQIFVNINAAIR